MQRNLWKENSLTMKAKENSKNIYQFFHIKNLNQVVYIEYEPSLSKIFHPDIVDLDANLTYRYTDNVESTFAYDEDNIVFYTIAENVTIIQLPRLGE